METIIQKIPYDQFIRSQLKLTKIELCRPHISQKETYLGAPEL